MCSPELKEFDYLIQLRYFRNVGSFSLLLRCFWKSTAMQCCGDFFLARFGAQCLRKKWNLGCMWHDFESKKKESLSNSRKQLLPGLSKKRAVLDFFQSNSICFLRVVFLENVNSQCNSVLMKSKAVVSTVVFSFVTKKNIFIYYFPAGIECFKR